MRNIQIYAARIVDTLRAYKPEARREKLLDLLNSEGLHTSLPILYGYDSNQRFFWFRNDPRGEMIRLPLHKVKVWPAAAPPGD